MNRSTTAPTVAVIMLPMVPVAAMPRNEKTKLPMKAPTIPTIIFPMTPKPRPFIMRPASQPATNPTKSSHMMFGIKITSCNGFINLDCVSSVRFLGAICNGLLV